MARVFLAWSAFVLALVPLGAQESTASVASAPVDGLTAAVEPSRQHEAWLEEVGPIILDHEAELFTSLTEDYQREAFIREFWRVRDPYVQTGRNELKERYLERLSLAQGTFPSLQDARARMLLVHGEPSRAINVRCTTTRHPAVVWVYNGSDAVRFSFVLIFLRGQGGLGPAHLWRPSRPGAIASVIRGTRSCANGALLEQVVQQVTEQGGDYEALLNRALLKPRPRSVEWVAAFRANSPRLPSNAQLFEASQEVRFVGSVQSRTAVQWMVAVLPTDVSLGDFAGHRSYDFELVGQVIRDGDLLDTFRYKFAIGEDQADAAPMPLVFQRNLRPGEYRAILRLEDLNGQRFHYSDRTFTVPLFEGPSVAGSFALGRTGTVYSEATAALAANEVSIRIMEPSGLQRGAVRFDTLASGNSIRRVRFLLDSALIATKTRPPFNVEVDLGAFPRERTLRVEALAEDGAVIATDEFQVNAGTQRFSVQITSPNGRESGVSSVLAAARIGVPSDATLDRVEYFVDERLSATLYQEPWTQPLRIADSSRPSYVRVVAHLVDGTSAEDLVFVNGGDQTAERLDVQVVEVYSAVLGRFGRPLEGLEAQDFTIEEDGVRQALTRFEQVRDLPFQVGIVIDNSASMGGALNTAKRAALRFLERTLTGRDRAALISFNRLPHLAVPLTSDTTALGAGLAGLTPQGQTALYDSLMFSLYYFTGIAGQRALLLLTDGRDEASRFGFAETLEYARRAGVTIYTVGLQLAEGGGQRSQLRALAAETGGDSYFIRNVEELDAIYKRIERDLRSQYLLAYQSTNTSSDDEFRAIEVKAAGAARVKAMSGYYP